MKDNRNETKNVTVSSSRILKQAPGNQQKLLCLDHHSPHISSLKNKVDFLTPPTLHNAKLNLEKERPQFPEMSFKFLRKYALGMHFNQRQEFKIPKVNNRKRSGI